MWQERVFYLAADHPSAPGHFPGRPVIPGALLLDALLAAALPEHGDLRIESTKFMHPVAHGAKLRLRWRGQGGRLEFEAWSGEVLVMNGVAAA